MVSADRRGQAFTLEGFVGALLLLATVAFVVQSTAVTPLSESTSSQHAETQAAAMTGGVLDAAAANGSLQPALLYWNESAGAFHGAESTTTYTDCAFPTEFGRLLGRSVYDQGFTCNVNVRYLAYGPDGGLQPELRRVVFSGTPSDNAVRAVRTVTLYDDDTLVNATGVPTNVTLAAVAADANVTYFAPDAAPSSSLYNVVEVEVVVWRT